MKFQVITLFPDLVRQSAGTGIVGQAVKKGQIEVSTLQPRDFATDGHRTVDDRPFGGGDGMIMLPEIVEACVKKARENGPTHVVYMSPQGSVLNTDKVRELSKKSNITLLCGRYGGIDQRALNKYVDEEISIGDYVISGGELAALVVIDSVARFLPGVLGHADSAEKDSFANGLLEHPNFTRPREWAGEMTPETLLSGNHPKIEQWKRLLGILVTLKKRPDLAKSIHENDLKAAKKLLGEMSPAEIQVCGLQGLKF